MWRLLELALLGISLIAVGIIIYGYYRSARKAAEHKDMESDLSDFLKDKRKE